MSREDYSIAPPTPEPGAEDPSFGVFNASAGRFTLPNLPFAAHALNPVTGEETVRLHFERHHAGYVDKANALLADMARPFDSAVEVVAFARANDKQALFEQAGQALNHAFYWRCQQAAGLTLPAGALGEAVNAAFGDMDALVEAAVALAKSRVGSGWLWLVADPSGAVRLEVTIDADTWLDREEAVALLVCDLWEHAYYLDHQSDRAGWVEGFLTRIANWDFAEERFDRLVRGDGATQGT